MEAARAPAPAIRATSLRALHASTSIPSARAIVIDPRADRAGAERRAFCRAPASASRAATRPYASRGRCFGCVRTDRQHQRNCVLGHRVCIHAGRIAHGNATPLRRFQIDVVRAGPHGSEISFGVGSGRQHGIAELGMGADVDRNARSADPANQLGLVVGAALQCRPLSRRGACDAPRPACP